MVLIGTYPRGETVSCSERKKKEGEAGEKRERKMKKETLECMLAIREELSLFPHENDDFSLIL